MADRASGRGWHGGHGGRGDDGRDASAYERALGAAVDALHPRLRAYFAPIPAGQVGVGAGVFDVVGSPRRWLRPALALLAKPGIAFPVHEAGVPFRVENRTLPGGDVAAVRTFRLDGGERRMTDVVRWRRGHLVDALGADGDVRIAFRAAVVDGALELHSTATNVRVLGVRLRIPSPMAPRVRLVERFDEGAGRQRVHVTVDVPVIGRVYEYAGSFTYELRPEVAA